MRVIAGSARGRPLLGPRSSGTRPTSDLVRGAIFSMLEARGAWFTRVRDLYAGTGAMGIEALSRGAEEADFVERDRAACAIIRGNLERTGFSDAGRVIHAALPGALERLRGPYGLIFIDPPYDAPGIPELFTRLGREGVVDETSTIVYEHSRRTIAPERCGPLRLAVERVHGTTSLALYEAPAGPSSE